MSKSILIVDTPFCCEEYHLCRNEDGIMWCGYWDLGRSRLFPNTKAEWCPLKELPEKKRYDSLSEGNPVKAWGNGWNACLDEILNGGQ